MSNLTEQGLRTGDLFEFGMRISEFAPVKQTWGITGQAPVKQSLLVLDFGLRSYSNAELLECGVRNADWGLRAGGFWIGAWEYGTAELANSEVKFTNPDSQGG